MYLLSQKNSGLQERQLTFTSVFWRLSNKMCCKETWIFNTCLFTPWSRVLLEQLTGSLIVKKFPTFYGTRMFTAAFTSARHMSLAWAKPIQSMPPYRTSWRPILIFFSHPNLGLPSGLFPSDFPTNSLYTHLLSPPYVESLILKIENQRKEAVPSQFYDRFVFNAWHFTDALDTFSSG